MMPTTPPSHRRCRNPRTGFTLIELLVAISILAIMLFLINIIFIQTTQAVSTGVRQSNILSVGRAVNDRISRDATAMLGPNSQNPAPEGGGYIVIINHRIIAPVLRADGTERLESFRVDQLVFMASAEVSTSKVTQFRGAAPRDETQFGTDYASPYALVRYSHGRRTERDGTDQAGWVELGFDRNSGLDRLANDWMFTRQAVLFNPTDRLGNTILQNGNSDWFVDTPRVPELVQASPNADPMWMGYCDVTHRPASAPLTSALPGFVNMRLDPSNPGLTSTDIEDNYLFLTHINQRLRVNPIPDSSDFESEPVGQLHSIFAPNCSDFIVQFAADANNDGEIDRLDDKGDANPANDDNTGTEANGDPIFWYDFDTLDRLDGSYDGNVPDIWTGGNWGAPTGPSPLVDVSASAHGSTAFIFRYEDDGPFTTAGAGTNSKWPYLIRIRYRLHDAPGRIEGNATFRQFDGVDQNGINGVDDNDEQFVSGQYFEQIIRVPRPQTP